MAELSDDQDAFGLLLQDYVRGEQGIELVERDDGFVGSAGSPSQYFAPFDAWPAHEQAALSWAQGRVLDIGCGAGRHALHLQEQGLDVVGIDISPRAVAVCRERGLRDARVLDIAQVARDTGPWDTVFLLGANFGLAGSAEGTRTLLARLDETCAVGARVIAESRDPSSITDPIHTAYREANVRRGRLPGQLRIRIRYKLAATPWFDYLFVSKQELGKLLEGTGWRAVQYSDESGEGGAYIALIEKVGL
jgi:SAM-dependent methyltransferase